MLALASACSGSGPDRTVIFVSPTPSGTAEPLTSQPETPATPTPAQSTAVPTPTSGPTSAAVEGTPTPEPTVAAAPVEEPAPVPAIDITAQPLSTIAPAPTPTQHLTPTITPSPATGTGPVIECVFFDGLVRSTEADEYVQVLNQGASAIDLAGWRLVDRSDGSPEFTFPPYQLQPLASARVYTNEVHPESGGFSFQRKSSIWNNSDPDEAALIDPSGTIVSTYLYPPSC